MSMNYRHGAPPPPPSRAPAMRAPRSGVPTSPAVALQARRPPQPKQKREPRRDPSLVRIGSALLTITVVGLLGVVFALSRFEAAGPLVKTQGFKIARGEGHNDIIERLEREGVISNRWVFSAVLIANRVMGVGKPGDLKAGTYEFKPATSMREVADTLIEGKSSIVKVTIPEGLTSNQIVERLRAIDSLGGEISAIPAEGSLLPDTLQVARGLSRQEIIDRLRTDQQRVLAAAWEKRAPNLPIETPEQAIILASIVEKETGKAEERPRVAAVFVNRLRKGMRLQSDPTIIYGITLGAGPLGRPIYRSDIDQKTAYNTYQIDGLPPTPIANPGRQAIEAVLNPATTNELYFVADGTGGHTFSETLKEHNAAVAKWRQVEREQKAQREAAEREAPASAPAAGAGVGGPRTAAAVATGPGAAGPVATVGPVTTRSADALPIASPAATVTQTTATASGGEDIPLPVRKPKR